MSELFGLEVAFLPFVSLGCLLPELDRQLIEFLLEREHLGLELELGRSQVVLGFGESSTSVLEG